MVFAPTQPLCANGLQLGTYRYSSGARSGGSAQGLNLTPFVSLLPHELSHPTFTSTLVKGHVTLPTRNPGPLLPGVSQGLGCGRVNFLAPAPRALNHVGVGGIFFATSCPFRNPLQGFRNSPRSGGPQASLSRRCRAADPELGVSVVPMAQRPGGQARFFCASKA